MESQEDLRLRDQELHKIKTEDMGKHVRVTITIPEKLLEAIDIQVQKGYWRSRSHAVEAYIRVGVLRVKPWAFTNY
jgi:hypothetical protein